MSIENRKMAAVLIAVLVLSFMATNMSIVFAGPEDTLIPVFLYTRSIYHHGYPASWVEAWVKGKTALERAFWSSEWREYVQEAVQDYMPSVIIEPVRYPGAGPADTFHVRTSTGVYAGRLYINKFNGRMVWEDGPRIRGKTVVIEFTLYLKVNSGYFLSENRQPVFVWGGIPNVIEVEPAIERKRGIGYEAH